VQDGYFDLSTVKAVRVRVDEVENYRLEVGDVLMTEGGDIDKLGRGTIWEGQIPDCLHQNHIFRIRPNRRLLEPAFYALVVESDIAKRYFNRVAKRTTNLASTNKTQVRAFRFPVPPTVEEQQEIVGVMTASKATITALVTKQASLAELKKSLMRDLLTGRVRVRDASKVAAS
jgi:type I restriction enzyme S subunit